MFHYKMIKQKGQKEQHILYIQPFKTTIHEVFIYYYH